MEACIGGMIISWACSLGSIGFRVKGVGFRV